MTWPSAPGAWGPVQVGAALTPRLAPAPARASSAGASSHHAPRFPARGEDHPGTGGTASTRQLPSRLLPKPPTCPPDPSSRASAPSAWPAARRSLCWLLCPGPGLCRALLCRRSRLCVRGPRSGLRPAAPFRAWAPGGKPAVPSVVGVGAWWGQRSGGGCNPSCPLWSQASQGAPVCGLNPGSPRPREGQPFPIGEGQHPDHELCGQASKGPPRPDARGAGEVGSWDARASPGALGLSGRVPTPQG